MDTFWQEVGFGAPDLPQLMRVALRLSSAVLLAAMLGYERERKQRPAGLRTHMLVALGAALFTIVPVEAGASPETLSRLVQGLAAGVGFLGAGAILKQGSPQNIHGLTTAASIWMAAAIGFAAGAGWIALALVATVVTYLILAVLGRVEVQITPEGDPNSDASPSSDGDRHSQ